MQMWGLTPRITCISSKNRFDFRPAPLLGIVKEKNLGALTVTNLTHTSTINNHRAHNVFLHTSMTQVAYETTSRTSQHLKLITVPQTHNATV